MAEEFVASTEYNLKWNSHNSTILSMLDSLLERECLVDVTLACEGKFINVHRFMLYACSPYFEELLSQQPKKQAIIFLKDVTFANLQALIHFMYKGEVLIPEDQLGSFCQTAVSLKIKGLLFCDKEESVKVKSSAVHSSKNGNTRYTVSPQKTRFNGRSSPPSSPVRMQPIPSRKPYPRLHTPSPGTSQTNAHTEPEQMTFVNGMHSNEVDDDVPIIERRKRTIARDDEFTLNGKKQQMIDTAEEQVTVAAVSNRKVKPVAAKSHTPPFEFFESAPTTPQDEQFESNLDNEQQYDTADNDSISQEDDVEMYYSQDETMHANNNDTTSSRRSSRKTKSSMSNGKSVKSRRYSASSPMHVCGKCGRSYSYKGSLITHMADCGKTSHKTPRK